MKFFSFFALVSALLTAPAVAVEYTVSSCAELADVDDTLATGLTIDTSTFACDEYTRFRVRNTMTLKSTGTAVDFSNFSLKVLGELTVEPDVAFTGVVEQVKNGGVLNVAEGAKTTFMGTAEFSDNSVLIKQLGTVSCGEGCTRVGPGLSYATKKGGAIHNKGMLTFEGDATLLRNEVHTDDSVEVGKGGAVSNTASGTILFKGNLRVESNSAEGFFEGQGGAFYNRGDIVVDGESYFELNESSDGGAIYQTEIGTMTFNGMATFLDNECFDMEGGAINNDGGVMTFVGGSLFEGNYAGGSGDGGIGGAIFNGNGGVITLTGSTTFQDNGAYWGGAIYNTDEDGTGFNSLVDGLPVSVTTFPDDTVFDGNRADGYCPDVHNGDNDNCPVV